MAMRKKSTPSTISLSSIVSDPGARIFVNASDSVHYRQSSGASCHARTDNYLLSSDIDNGNYHPRIPMWVHSFASTRNCSVRTQAGAVAHLEIPDHNKKGKVIHRRRRRHRKKQRKQELLLEEHILPDHVSSNLLTADDILNDIIVFDGGDADNPPIIAPKNVKWRSIRVRDHPSINIHDTLNPEKGLTSPRIDGVLPFIRLPRLQSLLIMGEVGQDKIFGALESCEKLRRTSLVRGDRKRIFGDHGKPVWYTCAGVQVSRNSPNVLDAAPSMDALPMNDWLCLMRIMRWAENCFEYIADHEAVSHIRAAKALLDFKTMNIPADESITPAKYFGGIGFGCNVYLRCHTDEDFTMSVIQVHLKGRTKYELDDEPVVFFCFPSLGVAVPLRPGDFLVFNPLIPHCISSRCRQSDDVMSLSMFLKSSVVGLNNNQLALTEEQRDLAKSYHSIALNQPNLPQRQRKALKRYHKFYTQL